MKAERTVFLLILGICFSIMGEVTVEWTKITLNKQYYTESNCFADFDKNGKVDVCSGPWWYEGPSFTTKHDIYSGSPVTNLQSWVSNWHTFVYDMNGDGYMDIVIITAAGTGSCIWYENPKNTTRRWSSHQVFTGIDMESPTFTDIDGDEKPEFVGVKSGYWGFAAVNWSNPTAQCQFHNISPKGTWFANTHGMGVGDVNKDGRMDLITKEGWWEQPASLTGDPQWKLHEYYFAPKGSSTRDGVGPSQMPVYDVNGDGRNDVVSALDAHGWGLAWFENVDDGSGGITFIKHMIMGNRSEEAKYGAAFSEPHAVALCDIDGDGLKDVVSAKRWWVHKNSGSDPETDSPAVAYWFRLTRSPTFEGGAKFTPHLIDTSSGIGTEIYCGDMNGDTYPDITMAGKKGSFIFLQKRTGVNVKQEISGSEKRNNSIRVSRAINGSVLITFGVPRSAISSIGIYTAKGEKIRTLSGKPSMGNLNSMQWDGKNDYGVVVPHGLYVLHLENIIQDFSDSFVW